MKLVFSLLDNISPLIEDNTWMVHSFFVQVIGKIFFLAQICKRI
jgi:hypothetical protein